MPPKTASAPRKEAPIGRSRKLDKSKKKGSNKKPKVSVKKWLKTPADWARFDAWAKINALPRKIPEPEVVVRPSKPLSQFKKRLRFLAEPHKQPDPAIHCRLDLSITKTALNFIASKRLIRLSWPNFKMLERTIAAARENAPKTISRAALKYQASPRIIEISLPRIFIREECRTFEVSKCAMLHEPTEREKQMALAKKLVECPEMLTDEERAKLFTPTGIRKSALNYQFTVWMELLSLPAYKSLMHRKDADAVKWKKMIIEEGDERGKQALEEQMRKRKEEQERGKKRKHAETKEGGVQKQETTKGDKRAKVEDKKSAKNDEKKEKPEAQKSKDEERAAKRRKTEKNAWRFQPPPCKDDPFVISQAALDRPESPRVNELATPRVYKNTITRANPFTVRKKALAVTASARVEVLAKPSRPRSPIERSPPREKDQFGKPIFKKPAFGKRLPKTPPYKMGDCNPPEKKEVVKKRPIDPIAYEPSVDPCIFPRLSRIQKAERKRAEKVLQKLAARKRKRKEEQADAKKTVPPEGGKQRTDGEKEDRDLSEKRKEKQQEEEKLDEEEVADPDAPEDENE